MSRWLPTALLTGATCLALILPVAAEPLQPEFLALKPGMVKEQVDNHLGKPQDISWTKWQETWMYDGDEQPFSLNVYFVPGDLRFTEISCTLWGAEPDTLPATIDAFVMRFRSDPALAAFGQKAEGIIALFGEPSSKEDWQLTYQFPEQSAALYFYLYGEDNRCETIGFRADYFNNVPPEAVEPLPPLATGSDDLRSRTTFFGVPLRLTFEEVKAQLGTPVREGDSFGDPTLSYFPEESNLQFDAIFSAPDAEEPGILRGLSLTSWWAEPAEIATAVDALRARGIEDNLLNSLGAARDWLRQEFGDPDEWSNHAWRYVIEDPDSSAVTSIEFSFEDGAVASPVKALYISRW